MNGTALITVAIGEPYFSNWKKYCEPSWQAYAAKHNMDVICIHEPLDMSERAHGRSPAWQKCLVLSQPFAANYQRVVLLDSDVVINSASAPNVIADVPPHCVGGVISGSHIPEDLRVLMLGLLRKKIYPYV